MSFVPVPAAVLNQWVRILGAIEKKINRQSFETWLKPTKFSHIEGRVLHVRIPSEEFQHIGEKYADHIGEAIDALGLELDQVVFMVPPQEQVRLLVTEHTQARLFGLIGEPHVNVLELNLSLDHKS